MSRHRIRDSSVRWRAGDPSWADGYRCEWGTIVGERVRGLRMGRGWSLFDLSIRVRRPDGGRYSTSFYSRLERGLSSAPLFAYVGIAEALEVRPGWLLGPDPSPWEVNDGEMTLVRFLRRLGITPDEALATLARPQ